MPSAEAFLLYAHGARDPDWATPLRRLAARLGERSGDRLVALAFLEHMSPGLDEAVAGLVAAGVGRVILVPLFVGRGGHLKKDLPPALERVRATHPRLELQVLPALGEDDAVVEAIVGWILGAVS